jgi:hypothetical protein
LNDRRKFLIESARLESLKENIPSQIGTSEVADYHSILEGLQGACGDDLAAFRISEAEMKPKLIQVQRGSFRGGPGRATYSKEKYCERTLFSRQISGLSRYIGSRERD